MNRFCIDLFAGAVVCGLALQCPAAAAAKDKEKALYSFCTQQNCADGRQPATGLTDVNGMLYGITEGGGLNTNCGGYMCGAVFALDPSTGAETVLYSFCSRANCTDGQQPLAGPIYVKGTLYGTTELGGAGNCQSGCGTVFALNPATGAETVVHAFANGTDGERPEAGLIEVNARLYGTTYYGGSGANGTVFSLNRKNDNEDVLYSFCSQPDCTDGAEPWAGLTHVHGRLYGTTPGGGANDAGTVFALDPKTGAEQVLYSFCGQQDCADGWDPSGNLIYVSGTLYGTAGLGGLQNCGGGCGSVFAVDPNTGAETVVYSFCRQQNCTDGANPNSVIDIGGTLYGTTTDGGANCPDYGGCGTIFSLDPNTGSETVLYSFCSKRTCTDGANPTGGLIDVKDTLYGTTFEGGVTSSNCAPYNSCGTVFSLKLR